MDKFIDPICGMSVTADKAAGQYDYNGTTYYFCALQCREKFISDPVRYLAQAPQPMTPVLVSLSRKTSSLPIVHNNSERSAGGATVKDPVCGMMVHPNSAAAKYNYKSIDYYFCHQSCHSKFSSDPEKYLHPPTPRYSEQDLQAEYTCPMDPEIVQIGPGICPKCGMALEPKVFDPNVKEDLSEYLDMRRRFWISLVFTIPLLILSMGEMIVPQAFHRIAPYSNVLQLFLATPVVFWCGFPFLERAWASIKYRSANMFTLIGIGTLTAYIYSTIATIAPELFPFGFQTHSGAIAVYFEAAAFIITLVLLGQILELKARRKTSLALKHLLGLTPKTARQYLPDGTIPEIPIESIQVGMLLQIPAGEKIPVDGIVYAGDATIDEAAITGESVPVEKGKADLVYAGTLNVNQAFVMEARKVGAETLLAQIVRLVGEAQRSRAPIQKVADLVAAYFVPAVFIAAGFAFLGWWIFGGEQRLAYGLISAISVLIIACPCAVGLATPMSIMVGIGKGALSGVLVKDAAALEMLAKVDTLVFDKTGTLTQGNPNIVEIHSVNGDKLFLERIALSLAQSSTHPYSTAITKRFLQEQVEPFPIFNSKTIPGRGISAQIGEKEALLGNESLITDCSDFTEKDNIVGDQLGTLIFISYGGECLGWIRLADPVKSESRTTVETLQDYGLDVIMVTGDHLKTAEAVAAQVGISSVYSEILPQQKKEIIEQLQQKGRKVAMIGDGINDAPALAQADVGIAMGTGTDVAIESAAITILQGDLIGVLKAIKLSRATIKNIRQNLWLAFLYNALGIPIAAGLLYPVFGLLLSPMIASTAMTFSSVSVITNALRLKNVKLG